LHSSTVHSFSDKVAKGFPRKDIFVVVFSNIEIESNEFVRDLEITLIEVILDVPTNLSELLALLDSSVEEG
jgi:hypothetical protein